MPNVPATQSTHTNFLSRAEVTEFSTLLAFASVAIQNLSTAEVERYAAESTILEISPVPIQRAPPGGGPGLNLRNNIRFGDTTDTPLQFVYEAADCRLFWTKDMLTDITAIWRKRAQVAWGAAKSLCVQGSTGHPSSVSGGGANSTNVLAPGPGPVVGGGNGTVVGSGKVQLRRRWMEILRHTLNV